MKAIISFLLSVMLYISSFAQFGIQESLFLEQLKEQELVSIIVKGDIEKIKETCISMNVNLKYAYQDLAAIQIEKEKNKDTTAAVELSGLSDELNSWVYPLNFIDFC